MNRRTRQAPTPPVTIRQPSPPSAGDNIDKRILITRRIVKKNYFWKRKTSMPIPYCVADEQLLSYWVLQTNRVPVNAAYLEIPVNHSCYIFLEALLSLGTIQRQTIIMLQSSNKRKKEQYLTSEDRKT